MGVPSGWSGKQLGIPSSRSLDAAAVIYPTMGALLARFARKRHMEVIPIAAAVVITMLVGLSRLVLGVHYPTDVLTGWSAGAAWPACRGSPSTGSPARARSRARPRLDGRRAHQR